MVSCQSLPIKELKEKGISSHEISETQKLRGNNGYQENYLIYRSKRDTENTSKAITATHFALSIYNKSKELNFVLPWEFGFSTVKLFEFSDNKLTILLRRRSLVPTVRVIEYDLELKKVVKELKGEIACEYGQDCNWINVDEKKLALFTNHEQNQELQHSTIYEYSWGTHQTRFIRRIDNYSIDAVTGRNFALKNVEFNSEIGGFEYNH